MRGWRMRHGGLRLLAWITAACGGAGGSDGVGPPAPIPAAIARVTGDLQTGIPHTALPAPLVVRVTDAAGAPIRGVPVAWSLVSGLGALCVPSPSWCAHTSRVVHSDVGGLSQVWLWPTAPGTHAVDAVISDLAGGSVTFTSEVIPGVIIGFGPVWDCGPSDTSHFAGPYGTGDVPLALGTAVMFEFTDWVAGSCVAQVVSTSVPADGTPFDSGVMTLGDRFLVRPDVAGTWEIREVRSGGTGRLVVQ